MSSNYPPGVTGGEYQIVGPDYEEETDQRCPKCEKGWLFEFGYQYQRWLSCGECDYTSDLPDAEEPDPDRAYDEARERRLFGNG